MKLVAVVGNAYPLFGGAQFTVWTLLKRLRAEHGFECALYTPNPVPHRRHDAGIMFATYRDADELKQMVRAAQPDVMFATLEPAADALRVATHFNIPTLVDHQSFEYYRPSAAEKRRWQVDPKRSYPSLTDVRYVLQTADLHVVNSRFMRDCYTRKYGVKMRVLYPEFEQGALPSCHHPEYITGICGMPYKGADIFLALADAFPQEKFLLVGDVHPDYHSQFQQRQNILMRGRAASQAFLSRSKIVVVPSLWPEPFGRIAVEALGAGIPTLVSYTGGLKEIVDAAPFAIREFRTIGEWRSKLGALLESEVVQRAYAAQGRTLAAKFLEGKSTRLLARWLTQLAARKKPTYDAPMWITLRGGQTVKTAYSIVNDALYQALAQKNELRLHAAESRDALTSQLPDIVIDSDFSQHFTTVEPPLHGKWIAIRPWDFGPYPKQWVEKINRECDQLWVHSRWARRQAIAGGVDAQRVKVVPLGFDHQHFHPHGDRYPLPTTKRFKFLFVGATILRKGIDRLLEAYCTTFTRADDVCLVIKDHAGEVFYQGISYRDEIAKWQRNPNAPEIIYMKQYLSIAEMGMLYRACDVSVFPYRAEGFGMPILEAMASGTPPIVPNFGACLDFCNSPTAFLMPARRIHLPVQGEFAINTLGFTEELQTVDFCEVRIATLSEYLRKAYELAPARLRKKAHAGVQRAQQHFTWQHAATRALQYLTALHRSTVPYRLQHARELAARQQKRQEAAQAIYEAYLANSNPT